MRLPDSIKRLTDPIVGRIPVRIASGVNKGLKWSLASAGSGYASGSRGTRQMQMLQSLIETGDVVWDVGAHHGYIVLLAARRIGPSGHVHAFEPSRRNRRFLARHLRWNALESRVTIHPYALSSFDGQATFGGTSTSKTYALGGGDEIVEVRTGESLVEAGECPPPKFTIIDVEGAEADVLRGALDVLPTDSRLLIAIHSEEAFTDCTRLLHNARYSIADSRGITARREGRKRWGLYDPDIMCFGPLYARRERDEEVLSDVGF